MPSAAQHQAKYERNRAFLGTGVVGDRPDWAAVVAFYAAVHLVEKLAALNHARAIHHERHVDREVWLRLHRIHRVIFNDYEALKDASLTSRYGTVNQFERDFDSADVQSILIDKHLAAIESHVRTVTKPPAPPAT